MRVCPECETEFEDGDIEVCPDCDVPLIEKSAAEESDTPSVDEDGDLPSDGLIVIEATDDEARVGLIRELLEDSGIPCFLSDELFAEKFADQTMVMIPREMEGDARRLIREYGS